MGFSKNNSLTLIRAGVGLLCLLFLSAVTSRLAHPFDTGHYEAFNWLPAQHILEGKNPYSFAVTPPYSMAPYGIVYYALLAAGVKLFGFQLAWGRILSVLAFAVCLWAVVSITKRITRSREASLAALLAGLAAFPAQGWIAQMRPDLIALAFSLTAVWLVISLEDDQTKFRCVAVAAILSAAAFFTKQTFLLVAVVVVLRLLQLRKRREALWFVAAYVILIGAGGVLLNHTSAGGYVWQHFIHARRLPYSFAQSFRLVAQMLTTPAMIIFVGLLLAFVYRGRGGFHKLGGGRLLNLRSPQTLMLFYFMLSFVWAFLSTGRTGANINYYLENSLVMAICFALIYVRLKRKGSRTAITSMLILLTLGGTFQLARVLRGEYFRWQALSYYREISETAARLTPPNSACVSVYAELVVRNGCSLHFDDFGEYVGGWSPELGEAFDRELRAGRYPVVVWNANDLQTTYPNYRLVPMSRARPERFFTVYLYVRHDPASQ